MTPCYLPLGTDGDWEILDSTEATGSGWGPGMQHGGPVAALLTRAMERAFGRDDAMFSRVTVEILGVVPIAQVRVRAWRERPGRRIELLAAEMQKRDADGQWRPVALARAWQLATSPTQDMAHQADTALPPAPLEAPDSSGLDAWRNGFVATLEWHLGGQFGTRGEPTIVWIRMLAPLVEGEETTVLQQVMAIADVANGVGARLDADHFLYVNTDLTVHLFDRPAGEWIGMRAETSVGPDGVAMSSAELHGDAGAFGRVAQSVLVQRR